MQYRPEIDGLRAVAVVPVVLFHAGFGAFSGGYVGVDVFFVISGYLITLILIHELDQATFSIARFYERRVRRILPALFFVVFACMPFAYMWMPPAELQDFSASVVAVIFFLSNFYFSNQVDYFAPAAELQPLMHTWSLAVEEQYYLLFPLFLLATHKISRRNAFLLLILLVLASFIFAEWNSRKDAAENFFSTLSRFWEIGIGSLCAFLAVSTKERSNDLLAFCGLLLIVVPMFLYDSLTPTPSAYTLAPVTGAALILLFAKTGTWTAKLLSMRLCVGVGLVSYSAYLWHQPLFAFARLRNLTEPGPILMLSLAVATFVLAWATWFWVEQPFRRRPVPCLATRRSLWMTSSMVAASIVALSVAAYLGRGFEWRFSDQVMRFAEKNIPRPDNSDGCLLSHRDIITYPNSKRETANTAGEVDVLLVGDSHANAISEILGDSLAGENIGFYHASYSGCLPLPYMRSFGDLANRNCHDFATKVYAFALSRGIKTIVLTSRFPFFLSGDRFNNSEGGIEPGQPAWFDVAEVLDSKKDDPARRERVLAAFEAQIRQLAQKFNVILVYPIPEAGWNVPNLAFRSAHFNGGEANLTTSYAVYKDRTREIHLLFDRLVAEIPSVYAARAYEALCSETTGRCLNSDSNGIYYYDDDHLSADGARLVVPTIVDAIKRAQLQD